MRKMFTFVLLFALMFLFAGAPSWGYDILKSPIQQSAIGSSPPAIATVAINMTTFEFSFVPMVTVGITTAPAVLFGGSMMGQPSRTDSKVNNSYMSYATDHFHRIVCAGCTIRAV